MSVCVAVKVNEGLVLTSDSASTLHGFIQADTPQGRIHQEGILNTYFNANKLLQIKDYPVGTLNWGISLIGDRTIESLIKEHEHNLRSIKEAKEFNDLEDHDTKTIAIGIRDHLKKYYEREFEKYPDSKKPPLGILVSGYKRKEFSPKQWLINFPNLTDIVEVRPDKNGKPSFGASWYGLVDAIVRLHWGRDDLLIQKISEKFKISIEESRSILDQTQYPVVFEGMPLQDAIDYAVYLINVVIGRYRFAIGAPLCGGRIDVAVIKPDEFLWVKKKTWNA